jgi:1-phosphofructokinase family hexose kinase
MQSQILVVALNPSIDVEWRVDHVRWEEKNVIRSERRWPGGKGVNVARWLRHLRASPRLLLPLGGRNGQELFDGLVSEALEFEAIRLREETRANIIVTTDKGRQMRFNPRGPCLSPREWKEFTKQFKSELDRAALVILSGSLPRNVPKSAYAELIRLASETGTECLLDCDGEALAVAAEAAPFLVKPNVHELEQWFGKRLLGRKAFAKAAAALGNVTGHWVLVSLGEGGGLLLNPSLNEAYQARASRQRSVNTVGAGDALLAGVAQAKINGTAPSEWLRMGVACGGSAVRYPAGVLPPRTMIRRVRHAIRVFPRRTE